MEGATVGVVMKAPLLALVFASSALLAASTGWGNPPTVGKPGCNKSGDQKKPEPKKPEHKKPEQKRSR